MTKRDMEEKLERAVSRTAPNDFTDVLSRMETRKGNVIDMTTKKKRPLRRTLVAACLALVLLLGGMSYGRTQAVASVISLDVNPSIELNVSKNETVLSCTALNAEAEEVLRDMAGGAELKGTSLSVAVNAIVGALLRNGYLESLNSAILISVEDADQTRATRLRSELEASVGGVLQAQQANAAVLSQTVEKSETLTQQAKQHHISTGKAALVNRVMALNGALVFDELAALSVEELQDLAETGAPAMPIGCEAAKQAAIHHAGGHESILAEVDAELDERRPHYEVELHTALGELEYTVDAYTGEILSGKEGVLGGTEEKPAGSGTAEQPAVSGQSSGGSTAKQPSGSGASADGDIGREQAKAIALAHAGCAESEVSHLQVEKDYDDGRLEYELEFRCGGVEYEYTVDGRTGEILEHEKEHEGHHSH